MKVPGKLKFGVDQHASERSDMQQKYAHMQHRLNDGKIILSDWIREFKRGSQDFNRLLFTAEQKAVIKDLVKQWKKGQLTNMLPVMDLIIRNIMLKDKSEESLLKLWFKTEQRFKKTDNMHVPAPVWKWIMKSSDQVILDPITANPTLVLSQDGCSVRTKTHEESDPWLWHQRTPHQYDGWPCVQAKKGYSTGRHYWEVDVTGKCDWRLGVVQESAPRCGFINLNTTTGYWTLRLQLGSLMALTDPVTKLNQATPSKIGMYLDMEEGQLSFYNTEKRKNIFTFKTDFSKCGRIYPVFDTLETN
ncbi:E3 ubiquitin-protein ligase TRIM39-like [Brachyhypopomus gauderio]|uniref:E3 ubiquitin-protein ligase TRIM39-like n=1 Tax=Brachyhypopomus gauderio TaxID=698409 RepID=UPI004042E1E1